MKITVRTSTDVVQTSARVGVYSVDGFLPSADVRTRPCGRGADARARVRADARGLASRGHGSVRTWGHVHAVMGGQSLGFPL
jgi:hypothetical protein